MIHILVHDSYHSRTIARNLQRYFGDRAVCHVDECPAGQKADIFVLSGLKVLEAGPASLQRFKSNKGTERSKIVVTSSMDEILREIKGTPQFGVDFTIPKNQLVEGLWLADGGDGESAQDVLDRVFAAVNAPAATAT